MPPSTRSLEQVLAEVPEGSREAHRFLLEKLRAEYAGRPNFSASGFDKAIASMWARRPNAVFEARPGDASWAQAVEWIVDGLDRAFPDPAGKDPGFRAGFLETLVEGARRTLDQGIGGPSPVPLPTTAAISWVKEGLEEGEFPTGASGPQHDLTPEVIARQKAEREEAQRSQAALIAQASGLPTTGPQVASPAERPRYARDLEGEQFVGGAGSWAEREEERSITAHMDQSERFLETARTTLKTHWAGLFGAGSSLGDELLAEVLSGLGGPESFKTYFKGATGATYEELETVRQTVLSLADTVLRKWERDPSRAYALKVASGKEIGPEGRKELNEVWIPKLDAAALAAGGWTSFDFQRWIVEQDIPLGSPEALFLKGVYEGSLTEAKAGATGGLTALDRARTSLLELQTRELADKMARGGATEQDMREFDQSILEFEEELIFRREQLEVDKAQVAELVRGRKGEEVLAAQAQLSQMAPGLIPWEDVGKPMFGHEEGGPAQALAAFLGTEFQPREQQARPIAALSRLARGAGIAVSPEERAEQARQAEEARQAELARARDTGYEQATARMAEQLGHVPAFWKPGPDGELVPATAAEFPATTKKPGKHPKDVYPSTGKPKG